ncbi:Receptor-type tyrosine-protein phosphatase F [Geodia barretti]|uniref:Receptor-type tyrosine-protein phosphatase F n=1 Tax=Geodia barretti TaxID=519541 RepID=A0AA35SS45_GEOBA|nr:Receptor-type tyrosine-protein phosphatase F [Geodia barretti]
MTVIWDYAKRLWLICGVVEGFRVEWTAVSGGEVHYQVQTGDLSEAQLTGLTPFASYSISIAAVNKEGQVVGTYSQPLTIKTNEDIPGPVEIVLISSLVQIGITWSKPARPNGIITDYEVSYGQKNSSRLTSANTGLLTNFSVRVKLGAEFTFTVRAFTRAGPGEPTTVAVSTLTKPPIVENVVVVSLNESSTNVSWRALDVPFLPVSYTVVYSPVSQPPMEENNESAVVFPPPATSGVITGLVALTTYQIQVFATVTVDGAEIAGEKSNLVYFVNEYSPSSQANPPSLSIVVILLTVVVVLCGIAVLAILVMLLYRKKKKQRSSYYVTPTYEEQHYVLNKGRQSDLLKHLWEQLDNKSMIYSTHQLRLSTALGHGVTGQVYKAYIKASWERTCCSQNGKCTLLNV